MSILKGKEIVLGITGCIAAYKAAELVRSLVCSGAQVHAVMTKNAQEFISPLTIQTLTNRPVYAELFNLHREQEISHISLAERADILVIAPATANCIGKIACGIADDLLTTVVMATKAPVLICPAMNVNMWENPVLQNNILTLKKTGCFFIEPETGDLACGVQAKGRLANLDNIIDGIETIFSPKDFLNKNVIVTAGPTREHSDPVRFISNPSSGKMGYAIARALKYRGANVSLISGPSSISPPAGVEFVSVVNAEEMAQAVTSRFGKAEIVIKAAAVSDYRPKNIFSRKIKKTGDAQSIEIEKTRDILSELGSNKEGKLLIGFAAETENLLENAKQKLTAKNLDMIVANDVSGSEAGFETDTNRITIIMPNGENEELPLMQKDAAAHVILDRINQLINS